jgi:hypothetical protein
LRLLTVTLLAVGLLGCSEPPRDQNPAEKPKSGGGIAGGMSEEVWKIYGGAESGVIEEASKPASPKEKQ